MSRSGIALLVGLVILILAVFGVWFLMTHERIKDVHWRGLQGDAKYDHYYLTERFLTKKGITVTRKTYYDDLDANLIDNEYETILLTNSGMTLSQSQIESLLSWVSDGHQLVLSLPAFDEFMDNDCQNRSLITSRHLLTIAGIDAKSCNDEDCPETCKSDNADANKVDTTLASTLSNSTDDSVENRLNQLLAVDKKNYQGRLLAGDTPILLADNHQAIFSTTDETVQHLTTQTDQCGNYRYGLFAYGRGYLVVYAQDPQIFSSRSRWFAFNHRIYDLHHASYLYWLLSQKGQPARLLWFERDRHPGLWTLIWQHWSYALIVMLVLIGFWVWRYSLRFGSLIVEDERKTLSIHRHLTASGEFYYKGEAKQAMVDYCYEQLLNDVYRHIPTGKQLSTTQLAAKIAQLTGLPALQIENVLDRKRLSTDTQFIHLTRMMNEIRKRL